MVEPPKGSLSVEPAYASSLCFSLPYARAGKGPYLMDAKVIPSSLCSGKVLVLSELCSGFEGNQY